MSDIASIVISKNQDIINKQPDVRFTLLPKTDWQDGSYDQEIRRLGGYWKANFIVIGSEEFLLSLFDLGLMSTIEVENYRGAQVWEGYISSMIHVTPDSRELISINDMTNRVWLRYQPTISGVKTGMTAQLYSAENVARLNSELDGSASAVRSTVYENVPSQQRYGIKEEVYSGGVMNATLANQNAQNYLNDSADPTIGSFKFDFSPRRGQHASFIEVECKGFFHTFDWVVYNQTASTGDENASDQAALIVTSKGQFVKSSSIASNTTQISREHDADRRAGDLLFATARAGGGSGSYAVGMYEGQHLIYEPRASTARADVKYSIRRTKTGLVVIDKNGGELPPSEVRPNEWAYIESASPFDTNQGAANQDRRIRFIEAVTYSESGSLGIVGGKGESLGTLMSRAALKNVSLQ